MPDTTDIQELIDKAKESAKFERGDGTSFNVLSDDELSSLLQKVASAQRDECANAHCLGLHPETQEYDWDYAAANRTKDASLVTEHLTNLEDK